jgi:integrase
LSDSEVAAVWKEFSSADPIRGAALKVLLLTGQRKSEVAHMRWEHVKDGWWELPGAPSEGWPGTKNAKGHRIWLSEAVRDIITVCRKDDGVDFNAAGSVFNGTYRNGPRGGDGGDLNIAGSPFPRAGFVFGRAVSGLDKAMRDICTRLGIERATPHDLRRTFGSTVTRLRFGRQAMDRILNHSDGGVGATYDRYAYEREDRRIMEAVSRHFLAIVEGRQTDTVVRGRFTSGNT